MTVPPRGDSSSSVLLWQHGTVICTYARHAPDDIEILISEGGVTVSSQRFTDDVAAADFAIAMRHTFEAD